MLLPIRSNYDLWFKRITEIEKGEAILSVRQWKSKPYNSKQIELFKTDLVGIQHIEFSQLGAKEFPFINSIIDHRDINEPVSLKEIATNDGLTIEDFLQWFFPKGLTRDKKAEAAIIHFTNFKY